MPESTRVLEVINHWLPRLPSMPRLSPSGDWSEICTDSLSLDAVSSWAIRPSCGALVTFCGTVRDQSEGRPGIIRLDYEAYVTYAEARLDLIAEEARRRWPDIARLALLHRVGSLTVGELAVIVAVSTPHRRAAFEAASWGIDTLKESVPIWKYEVWDGGAGWGSCGHDFVDIPDLERIG